MRKAKKEKTTVEISKTLTAVLGTYKVYEVQTIGDVRVAHEIGGQVYPVRKRGAGTLEVSGFIQVIDGSPVTFIDTKDVVLLKVS